MTTTSKRLIFLQLFLYPAKRLKNKSYQRAQVRALVHAWGRTQQKNARTRAHIIKAAPAGATYFKGHAPMARLIFKHARTDHQGCATWRDLFLRPRPLVRLTFKPARATARKPAHAQPRTHTRTRTRSEGTSPLLGGGYLAARTCRAGSGWPSWPSRPSRPSWPSRPRGPSRPSRPSRPSCPSWQSRPG